MDQFKERLVKVLRWSERYIKTDMAYIMRGGFWLTFGQAVSSASSFLLAIAFANFFDKETYGVYKYVFAVIGILTIPTLRYMNIATTQSVAQGKEGTALAALKIKILWGLLSVVGALAVGGYFLLNGNKITGLLLLICSPFLPFKDSFSIYVSILNGKRDFRRATLLSSIPTILGMVIITTILVLTRNVYFVLLSYFIFWTLANLILLKKTLQVYKLNNIVDQKSIVYGKKVSLIGVLATIAAHFDKLITYHYLGAASLAVYSVALAPISQINGMAGNINTLATPNFSKQDSQTLKGSLKTKEWRIAVLSILISLLYIVLSDTFFDIFFPKYEEAVSLSQIIAVSIPFTVIARFRLTAIQSRFAARTSYIYASITSITQIVLNFIGVYFFGLTGIVASYVLICVFQLLTTWIMIKCFNALD